MKKYLIVMVGCLIISSVLYLGYKWNKNQLCEKWFVDTQKNYSKGYFADSIKSATLYFSSNSCRGKRDPEVITILANAREHVILPDYQHLPAQLMMMRMGLSLKENDSQKIKIAEAFMLAEKWDEARQITEGVNTITAYRIQIAASLKLKDFEAANKAYVQFIKSEASEYSKAIVSYMMSDLGLDISHIYRSNSSIRSFVSLFFNSDFSSEGVSLVKKHREHLNDEELLMFSSMAMQNSQNKLAILALSQPERAMPEPVAFRLGKLLWQQGRLDLIVDDLSKYQIKGAIKSRYLLLLCLAEKLYNQRCSKEYNVDEFERIEGVYVSSRMKKVFHQINSNDFKSIIDNLDGLEILRKNLPIISHYQGCLYNKINERLLAEYYFNQIKFYRSDAVKCNIADNSPRLAESINKVYSGVNLTEDDMAFIKLHSPDFGQAWRLLEAKKLANQFTDQSMVKVISILRPVLERSSSHSYAHKLMSAAFIHFKDNQQALLSLIRAVESDPNQIAEVSRLALGFYEKGQLESSQLVNWWYALSHEELKTREKMSVRNFRDRFYLLSIYGKQNSDMELYIQCYERLLEMEPENDIALNNLAYALLKDNKDLDRAKRLIDKAVAIQPNISEYQLTKLEIDQALVK